MNWGKKSPLVHFIRDYSDHAAVHCRNLSPGTIGLYDLKALGVNPAHGQSSYRFVRVSPGARGAFPVVGGEIYISAARKRRPCPVWRKALGIDDVGLGVTRWYKLVPERQGRP